VVSALAAAYGVDDEDDEEYALDNVDYDMDCIFSHLCDG
jgi:hypothetical protein